MSRPDLTFTDRDGNVRTISAGKGTDLKFTNLDTAATLETPGNGANTLATVRPDGSQVVMTGHNILFMFPTDNPPGPSTTLYVGRVEFTIDPAGNYTVLKSGGTETDICAALSN